MTRREAWLRCREQMRAGAARSIVAYADDRVVVCTGTHFAELELGRPDPFALIEATLAHDAGQPWSRAEYDARLGEERARGGE